MILDSNSASGGYEIANSCKFNKAGSETMYKSNTNGDRRTWTTSFWMKFCGGTGSGTDTHMLYHGVYGQGTRMFTSGGTDQLYIDLCALGSERYRWITNQVFRDRSAWYHIVWRVDTTQSSLGDRMRLYVNGEQITDWQKEADDADSDSSNSGNKMPQNYQTLANLDHSGYDIIQFSYKEASIYCDMYMTEFHHCDGYSYGPTEFGKFDNNGIWVPIEADVSYGNNGCYLDFEDSSNLGNDANGGTDFTLSNISAVDQATDTPTNNFCTPLLIQPFDSTDSISHTEGGTKLTTASGTGWRTNMATMSLSSGKWYFEAKHPGTIDGDGIMTSIVPTARFGNSAYASFYGGQSSGDGLGWYWDSKRFRYDDGSSITPTANTVNSGDILSIALDMDNNYVYSRINGGAWHNNGSANGDPTSGSSGTGGFAVADEPHMICTSMYHPNKNFFVNFGGYNAFPVSSAASDANGYGTFEYAPPSGYYAICTKNLAEYG